MVFQDFQLLCPSRWAKMWRAAPEYDRGAGDESPVWTRASATGWRPMPKGLDTMLYKDFAEDGVEVSGGEAQKIAIARALYKDAPFIILDEPTAALDPIAEAEIYEKFNEISRAISTAIYISHRLSSCKFCDEIAVFNDGRGRSSRAPMRHFWRRSRMESMPNFGTPRHSITPSKLRILTVRRIDISAKKETGRLCFWEILSAAFGAGVAKMKDMV